VKGVSPRKVKAITEELCGHSFAASSIGAITNAWTRTWPNSQRGR
jgi:putative transposase